jgi:hypothetical protein
MKLLLFTILIAFCTTNSISQTISKQKSKSAKLGKTGKKGKKDNSISTTFFTGRAKVKNGIRVYRLHLLTSADRNIVYQTKSIVYQRFPNQKQIVMNALPMYKLWFGSFLNKAEAERYKKILSPMFPDGIYIITDVVELVVHKVNKPAKVKTPAPVVQNNEKPTKKKSV